MIGLSGGGTVTTFASALEDRIKVAVISGYFCAWRESILPVLHCECNYVPGILQYAECYDVASLIAPRPLLIEAGTKDNIFPLAGVKNAFAHAERVWELLGVRERLDIDIFEGEHQWSGAKAWDFLAQWL